MTAIHRMPVDVNARFKAPLNVTFGWQEKRQLFCLWFDAADADNPSNPEYIVVGTGHPFQNGTLVASIVLPDGFHTYHLIRL